MVSCRKQTTLIERGVFMKSSVLVSKRNYGIDALRILCIFMVLALHILGLGGIADKTSFPEPRFLTVWSFESLLYCVMNCYALITGYVMIQGKYRYTNLIVLWLQVVLVSVGGAVLYYFLRPGAIDKVTVLLSAFPVSRRSYWYFSCYFALYLLIPLLNRAIHSLNRKQAKVLCILLIAGLSGLTTLLNADPFSLGGGYCALWLMVLYILGACIRKFDFGAKIRSRVLVIGFFLGALITVGVFALLHLETFSGLLRVWRKSSLLLHTSPTILFNSIALLLLFTRLKFRRKWVTKIIGLLSSLSFGVYILHAHPLISNFFFLDKPFAVFADYPIPMMLLSVLLSAAAMFAVFGAIEWLRIRLFEALKVKKRLLALEEKHIGNLWSNGEKQS